MAAPSFADYVRTRQSFSDVRDVCPIPFCDFADYYYLMGEAVFRSGLPVEGFLYSAFIATPLAVFPPLGLSASLVRWGILEVLGVSLYVHHEDGVGYAGCTLVADGRVITTIRELGPHDGRPLARRSVSVAVCTGPADSLTIEDETEKGKCR